MNPQETSPTPEDPTTIHLGADNWEALQEALDAPPHPMPRMQALLQEPGYFDGPAPSLEDLREGIRRAVADRHAPGAKTLDAVQAACAEALGGGGAVDEFLAERRQEAEADLDEATEA